MDESKESSIWALFEEVAPNLCYLNRTRDLLKDLIGRSEDHGDLLVSLEGAMADTNNPSFRTDLKILRERLQRKSPLEG